MTEEKKPVSYTMEERQAIVVIRKSMLKKPEIIEEIMKNGAYELAQRVLLKTRDELNQLLEVNRAFSTAAAVLAKKQKAYKEESGS